MTTSNAPRFGFPKSAPLRIAAAMALTAACNLPLTVDAATVGTIVRMETSLGVIHIGLYDSEAPLTVANFLNYVKFGDYDGTVIHRSEPNFVIQGGGYTALSPPVHIPTAPPVTNEFDPSRLNLRGTIAMARTSALDSATSEWFFNLADNPGLDDVANNNQYAVFGEVLDSGMDVIDAIAALPIEPFFCSLFGFCNVPFFEGNFVFVFRACVNNDRDAVCQQFEDFAPNNGDGNNDGTPDRDQPNVASTRLNLNGRSVTFAAGPLMRFDVAAGFNLEFSGARLASFLPPPETAVRFDDGVLTFTMIGTMGPAGEIVTLFDRAATRPTRYYAYASNPQPRWYDFTFDGTTGAEIQNDRIVLHFVDGGRGDDDGAANGTIMHTGAPAIESPFPGGSTSDSGCTIAKGSRQMSSGADWGAVFAFLAFAYLRTRRPRNVR